MWDPGARILIYTDNKTTVSTTGAGAGAETKEKNTKPSKQLERFINTRASPNKSQDSGFSDSGESESSNTSETKGSDFKIKAFKTHQLTAKGKSYVLTIYPLMKFKPCCY